MTLCELWQGRKNNGSAACLKCFVFAGPGLPGVDREWGVGGEGGAGGGRRDGRGGGERGLLFTGPSASMPLTRLACQPSEGQNRVAFDVSNESLRARNQHRPYLLHLAWSQRANRWIGKLTHARTLAENQCLPLSVLLTGQFSFRLQKNQHGTGLGEGLMVGGVFQWFMVEGFFHFLMVGGLFNFLMMGELLHCLMTGGFSLFFYDGRGFQLPYGGTVFQLP